MGHLANSGTGFFVAFRAFGLESLGGSGFRGKSSIRKHVGWKIIGTSFLTPWKPHAGMLVRGSR